MADPFPASANPLNFVDPYGLCPTWASSMESDLHNLQTYGTSFEDGLRDTMTVPNAVGAAAWQGVQVKSGYNGDRPELYLPNQKDKVNSLPLSGRIGTEGIGGVFRNTLNKPSLGYAAWIHNPSHGKGWDIIETGIELIKGPGTWSRETAKILDVAARGGGQYDFVAHSQGGVQLGQALGLMQNQFSVGSTVRFVNTPYNPFSANISAQNAGLTVDYRADPRDIVSALGNPWNLPVAVNYLPAYIISGAKIHDNGGKIWEK